MNEILARLPVGALVLDLGCCTGSFPESATAAARLPLGTGAFRLSYRTIAWSISLFCGEGGGCGLAGAGNAGAFHYGVAILAMFSLWCRESILSGR
jgi:hypothetical protein